MKRIKDLIYYMFYRVAKCYKYWDCGWRWTFDSYYMSGKVVDFSIGFFVLSIIIFVLHYLFDKQLTDIGLVIIMSIVMLIVVCITSVLIGDEEKNIKNWQKNIRPKKTSS